MGGRVQLTRGQFVKGAGFAAALLTAGRWSAAGAQEVPEGLGGVRPIRGQLPASRSGRTVEYAFDYPGGEVVYTVEMQVRPDSAIGRAGFRVYNPSGAVHVTGGAQSGLQPNVSANVVSRMPGRYLVQVYNASPETAVDYWVRLLTGRPEGQPVPSEPSIGAAASAPMIAYVGSYTTPDRQGHGKGIEVYQVDPATGGWTKLQSVETAGNPSFLAIDPTQRFLYSIHGGNVSQVSAFQIDPASGRLTYLNGQSSNGNNPVYPVVDATSRWVLIANYTGGSIAAYPVGDDGRLGEATDVVKHSGALGPNTARQEAPHPHQITFDPAGRYVFVPDLGLDRVFVYRFVGGKFQPNDPPAAAVVPGSGPRHIAFHPSGAYAYVISEMASTMSVFAYDQARGALQPIQVISTLPPDFTGESASAEVVVAPSGQFVYGSNRGHDSIAVFAIDGSTGLIAPVDYTPIGGKTPRHFNLDPTGSFLYAEGQDSDTIATFRVDAATGKLSPTGQVIETGSPVSLVFGQV